MEWEKRDGMLKPCSLIMSLYFKVQSVPVIPVTRLRRISS